MAGRQGGYSRFIAFAKIALPLTALALVASVFLVSAPDDFEGAKLVFSKADLEELRSSLRVKDAVLTGRSPSGEIYKFSADLVIPDGPSSTQLTATAFRGEIEYPGGLRVNLISPMAIVWLDDQIAELSGGVELRTSDGYSAFAERVSSNFRSGVVESDRPVSATGPFGDINAGSFRLFRQQDAAGKLTENPVILFENKVRLVFTQPDGR